MNDPIFREKGAFLTFLGAFCTFFAILRAILPFSPAFAVRKSPSLAEVRRA
jgi:hypothetical protein